MEDNYNLCKLVGQQPIYIRKSNKKISSMLIISYKKWPKMNFLECYVRFICIIITAIFITFSSNCNSLELIHVILFHLKTDTENVLSKIF